MPSAVVVLVVVVDGFTTSHRWRWSRLMTGYSKRHAGFQPSPVPS
jgi:hypothetical protein